MVAKIVEFDDVYTVVEGLSKEDAGELVLETYGKDLEIVKKQLADNPKKLWTIVDDGEKPYAVAGFHYVNRLNYAISEEEWKDEDEVYIW